MDPTAFADSLAFGLAHCRVVAIEHGELLTSLFLAGLIGSAGHCIGMCGPFVLAQTVARLEATPVAAMGEWTRLRGAALIPYHLGRLTTYVVLGSVAAALAGGVIDVTGLRSLSALLLAIAAVLFAGYAVQRLGYALPWPGTATGESALGARLGRLARPLFGRPVGWRGYGLGIVLGFLPCGLLYGALAAAAASGGALSGAMGMAAFAVGTVPALIAIGLAGHVAGRRWQGAVARITPVLFLLNAAALSWLAWTMVA